METNFKKEIATNLRGFIVTQIIPVLVKNNMIKVLLTKKNFSTSDFKAVKNKRNLKYIFDYFSTIGYFNKNKNFYFLTELGKDLLRRHSSFLVPHSYKNYFSNINDLITKKNINIKVDRDENILGSGKTHMRYFLTALNYLKKSKKYSSLLDIGIGNGDFAIIAKKDLSLKKICGVDFSLESVRTSKKKLLNLKIKNLVIKENAKKVENWSNKIIKFLSGEVPLISMWFLIQEISSSSKRDILIFLNSIKKKFPKSKIILCELVKADHETYSKNREHTFMPEYMLFHDLSHQGVFCYEDLKNIIKKSNYKIEKQFTFDELENKKKKSVPSCVVYILK